MFMTRLKRKGMFFCKTNETVAKKLRKSHSVRKILSVILSAVLILVLVPQKVFGIDDYVEENGNWTIYTAQGLVAFRDAVNEGNTFIGKTVALDADIDLSGISWVPIGIYIYNNTSKLFKGTFDGGNHTISNLHLDVSKSYTGLFSYIYESTVKNLTLNNVTCTEGTNEHIGGICGYSDRSTVSNCVVNGDITGGNNVGGICGYSDCSAISNCVINGSITGDNNVGGICGYISGNDSTISDCVVKGTVKGGDNVGGICGYMSGDDSNISSCIVSDSIISGKEKVGGICGETYESAGKISRCAIRKTTISATNLIGSICGKLYGVYIEECFSNADISGQIGVGGICGGVSFGSSGKWSGINDCYFTGTLTGESEIGGIVGTSLYSSFDDHISNCYSTATLVGAGHIYNGTLLCYVGGIIGYDISCRCRNCVCLSPPEGICGTGNPDVDVIAYTSAEYQDNRPASQVPGSPASKGNDSNCFYRDDLGEPPGIGQDGEAFQLTPGWQQIFIDLGWDQEIWDIPTVDLSSPDYSIAALPTIKKMNTDQHPLLPHVNDFYYLCKAEDVSLLSADVPRFDLGDGYFRLWMNEDFYDYKKGTPLKVVDPIVGWVPKDDPNGAVLTELGPAEEYSKREIVASFGAAGENVFEAPVGDGTIVKVVDPYNQISKTWRLVVEPVNDDLQSHGYDHALAVETEHGKLFLIYFVDESGNKVGEITLEKPVKVSVPVPSYYDYPNDVKVFYVDPNKADTEHKLIGTEMMGDQKYAVFETPHFSPYALIDILNEQEKAERANSKNPATSDETYTLGSIVVSWILAGAVLAIVAKNRKKKFE